MAGKEQYRSKLVGQTAKTGQSQGALTRGIGSAYAQNQALAGAEDPEAAAALAAMGEGEAQRRMEKLEKQQVDIAEKRRDMQYASENEGWECPGEIKEATLEQVLEWYPQLEEWRRDIIDQEVGEDATPTLREYSVDPDDPLYNPLQDYDRKKEIEEDLEPLDFDSMVFLGHTEQIVPVRDNFSIVFRTISTQHSMWIEMMLTDLTKYSMQYGRHWFSLTQCAVSVQTINDKPIGPDLGRFTEFEQKDAFRTALDERMKFLGKMPSLLTDELIVQHSWFIGRVRKMMAGDITRKVGNS